MEGQTKHFDPQWISPLTFLDELYQRGHIHRENFDEAFGKFVLVSGQLTLLDLGLVKSAWDKPVIQRLIKSGLPTKEIGSELNRSERRRTKGVKSSEENAEFDFIMAMLSIMPHTLQARLLADDFNVWCILDDSFVVGRASDLILKHGSLIQGKWSIIGILDASPWDPDYKTADGESAEDIVAKIAETSIGQVAARLLNASRGLIGRPPSSYGITPIIIFRDVLANEDG